MCACAERVGLSYVVIASSPAGSGTEAWPTNGTSATQGELFPFGANAEAVTTAAVEQQPPAEWKATYHLVDTADKFNAFLKKLKKQKRFAIDLETTGLNPLQSEIVGYACCWQAGEAHYLAVKVPEGE